MSDWIEQHINAPAAWVGQEEERDSLTLEALADVDAGRAVDHEAVQAWTRSLGPLGSNVVNVGANLFASSGE